VGRLQTALKTASKQAQNGFNSGLITVAAQTTYEFGPYRLEVSTRRLFRGDELIPLAPKAFDILVALIDRRDRVVDKSELMKLVWPDSFVEEANLSQTIFVLRKTLGDDRDGNQYIETVPRRGYRFAADVRVIETAPPAAVPASKRKWVIAAATIVAVAVVAALWAFRGRETVVPADGGITRIAVLPFENLTTNRDDDWLASAFSESLTSGLEGVDRVVTVSRNRIIELYRQEGLREASPVDGAALRRIAEALDIRYYVHGTYQRIDQRLRVVARMVDLETGTNTAQETLTDDFTNLLKLEDDLAGRFGARLDSTRRAAASRAETTSLEAYRAVVLGHNAYASLQLDESRAHLRRAIDLDPNYAVAWALLGTAIARQSLASQFASGSQREMRQAALDAARRAVELTPESAHARAALALAHRASEQSDGWKREAEKAVALNPRLPDAHELLGNWYKAAPGEGCSRGYDVALAEQYYRTALRLDPRYSFAWGNLIYHLHFSGQVEEAMRAADEAVRELPANSGVRRARSTALVWANRLDEAEQEIATLSGGAPTTNIQDQWVLGAIALFRGDRALASRWFDEVVHRMPDTVWPLVIARSYFVAGMIDQGLAQIDAAVKINPDCRRYAAALDAFAPYREHPQFRARLSAWKQSGS
jgi:DNA-binding winged helix-turn-helix (wHTH) protein/TolB-like protein/Tfp pilus assembly protein PilF